MLPVGTAGRGVQRVDDACLARTVDDAARRSADLLAGEDRRGREVIVSDVVRCCLPVPLERSGGAVEGEQRVRVQGPPAVRSPVGQCRRPSPRDRVRGAEVHLAVRTDRRGPPGAAARRLAGDGPVPGDGVELPAHAARGRVERIQDTLPARKQADRARVDEAVRELRGDVDRLVRRAHEPSAPEHLAGRLVQGEGGPAGIAVDPPVAGREPVRAAAHLAHARPPDEPARLRVEREDVAVEILDVHPPAEHDRRRGEHTRRGLIAGEPEPPGRPERCHVRGVDRRARGRSGAGEVRVRQRPLAPGALSALRDDDGQREQAHNDHGHRERGGRDQTSMIWSVTPD